MTLAVFSPDGRYVLVAKNSSAESQKSDDTMQLWETASGKEIRRFEGHSDGVRSMAFSRNGQYLLTGSNDGVTRLWDATTGKQIRRFEGNWVLPPR